MRQKEERERERGENDRDWRKHNTSHRERKREREQESDQFNTTGPPFMSHCRYTQTSVNKMAAPRGAKLLLKPIPARSNVLHM